MEKATFERLRRLVEAGRAGGWLEVVAALDMGDIVLALRGDRGAIAKAVEVTGLSKPTLWRRSKLALHRAEIEEARPANLTEALKLVQRLEKEPAGEEGGEEGAGSRKKTGRPKRDPLEVLKERLYATARELARQRRLGVTDALKIVFNAYAEAARPAGEASFTSETEEGEPAPAPAALPVPQVEPVDIANEDMALPKNKRGRPRKLPDDPKIQAKRDKDKESRRAKRVAANGDRAAP